MTAPEARDRADVVAVKLVALAAALDATAGINLSRAPEHERGRAEAGVSESRREAAGALGRLGAAPSIDRKRRAESVRQRDLILRGRGYTASGLRSWARAWRAFADAP